MKAMLLLSLAAVFACACASPASPHLALWPKASKGRITGGADAARNQFPYQVSFQLEMFGEFDHYCGGSILSPTFVLTAGHCINDIYSLERLRVVAGILDLSEEGVIVGVAETLVHPDYEAGAVAPNDLALIRLVSALSFSESIQPIGLPVPGVEPTGRALLSGWGSISTGQNADYPLVLQYVEMPILTYDECAVALTDLFGDPEPLDSSSNVCTGPLYDGISACSGDSGGPLAQQGSNEIIGIVSWGVVPCGHDGAPSVFTKVSNFIDFIRENVPDLPGSSKTRRK